MGDLTVGHRRISSHSDTAVCLDSGGDLRAPSPGYRASSDTEGARLAPTSGRRKSWFKRMFSRDSDSGGNLSRSLSHVDISKSASDLDLEPLPAKPPGKLQPLAKTTKKKKKRSKSAATVAVDTVGFAGNEEVNRENEYEQKSKKDKRFRSKSAGNELVGSLRPDTDSSRSRSPSVSDGDGCLSPKGETLDEECTEDVNNSKQSRKGSKKSKKKDNKKFGSMSSMNSSRSATTEHDNSAKRDKKTESQGKAAKLAMALSLWKRKPKTKRVDEDQPGMEPDDREMFPDDKSDSWDSNAEDEEIMRIQSNSPVQSEQDIFCVTESGYVNSGNIHSNSNAKQKDLNKWYKETTADVQKKVDAAGNPLGESVKEGKKLSINEKVRKFTEKITQNVADTDDSDWDGDNNNGGRDNLDVNESREIDTGISRKIAGSMMPENVIETDESENEEENSSSQIISNASAKFKVDNMDGGVVETGVKIEEEVKVNKTNDLAKIKGKRSQNVIETDESEEESDKQEFNRKQQNNVIETDSDDDSAYVNKYITAKTMYENKDVYSNNFLNWNEQTDTEVDEVDGTLVEAHHVKAVKQCRNCLLCTR